MLRSFRTLACLLWISSPVLADEVPREEQRLDSHTSPGVSQSSSSRMISVEDSVFSVWVEGDTASSQDIFLSASFGIPAGYNFGAPRRIDDDDAANDHSPVVMAQEEIVAIAWLKRDNAGRDCVFARVGEFDAIAKTIDFGPVISVSGPLASDAGDADSLQGVMCLPFIYLSFADDGRNPGVMDDVYVITSSNAEDGVNATFADPVLVNDSPVGAGDVNAPEIAVPIPEDHHKKEDDDHDDGPCAVYVTWGDQRNGSTDQVFFSRSLDGGVTFEANQRVDFASPGSEAADIRIAAVDDFVYIAWNDNRINPLTDAAYFRHSADQGATFLTEELLSTQSGDVDSTRVGTAHEFPVFVAWADDRNGMNDIFVIAGDPQQSPGPLFTQNTALDVDFEDGLADSVEPVLQVSEGAVGVAYLNDMFTPGQQKVWLSFFNFLQPQFGWQAIPISYQMPDHADADSVDFNLGDHFPWEGHVSWVDDRNGGHDQNNDVFVSGLRRDHMQNPSLRPFK